MTSSGRSREPSEASELSQSHFHRTCLERNSQNGMCKEPSVTLNFERKLDIRNDKTMKKNYISQDTTHGVI